MKKENKESIEILDEMSKKQIDQLHKSTLNFSKQSFEIKKYLVITLTAAATIISKKGASFSFKEVPIEYIMAGAIITILFYIIDALTYYYQRQLRKNMIAEENRIYKRNNVSSKRKDVSVSLFKAFCNKSQIIYHLIILLFISIAAFNFECKHCYKLIGFIIMVAIYGVVIMKASKKAKLKVFISYTLRGDDLKIGDLKRIKTSFDLLKGFDVYIDRLDNNIPEELKIKSHKIELNNDNLSNMYQRIVKHNLEEADVVCVLKSDEISHSEWVKEERRLLEVLNKTYIEIEKNEWETFKNIKNKKKASDLLFVKELYYERNCR